MTGMSFILARIVFQMQIDGPTSDFIELYTNEIAVLKRKIQALTEQNDSISEAVSWIIPVNSSIRNALIALKRLFFFSIERQTLTLLEVKSHRSSGLNSHKTCRYQTKGKRFFASNHSNQSLFHSYWIFFRLTAEIEKLNAIVTSVRVKLKSSQTQNDESLRRLTQEKVNASKKNKELVSGTDFIPNIFLLFPFFKYHRFEVTISNLFPFDLQEEKVSTLEDELKDIEDLRQTVVSLMSKRKKPTKDKWHGKCVHSQTNIFNNR